MNEYDSNRLSDLVKKVGYERTEDLENIDCYILNTCHIREKATEKVYHDIGRLKKIYKNKKKLPRRAVHPGYPAVEGAGAGPPRQRVAVCGEALSDGRGRPRCGAGRGAGLDPVRERPTSANETAIAERYEVQPGGAVQIVSNKEFLITFFTTYLFF